MVPKIEENGDKIRPRTEKADFLKYAESYGFPQSGWGVGPSKNRKNLLKIDKKRRQNADAEKRAPRERF